MYIIIAEKYEGPAMTDQASNKLVQNAKRADTDRYVIWRYLMVARALAVACILINFNVTMKQSFI